MTCGGGAGHKTERHDPGPFHHEEGRRPLRQVCCNAFHEPLSRFNSFNFDRYATYNDDDALEMGSKPSAAAADDDDADESFDLKNYDIT